MATLTLAGCDKEQPAAAPMKTADDTSVDCAVGGATELKPVCHVVPGPGGYLTIQHPDGGFRRLQLYGKHVSTADGAEVATEQTVEGRTIVTVGTDRYALQGSGTGTPAK